jgi:glycosyltransferase involved in cell wall biosynthesis
VDPSNLFDRSDDVLTRGPHILIVSDTLPPDKNGVALIASRTAAELGRHGRVRVLGPRRWCAPPGVRYSPIPRIPIGTEDFRFSLCNLTPIKQAVREADTVIVHTLGPLGCAALYLSRRFGKRSTLFLHNDLPVLLGYYVPRWRVFGETAARLANRIERWAKSTATSVIVPPTKKWVMRWSEHEVLELRPPLLDPPRRRPSRPNGVVTLAYHGRVSPEKAVDVIVTALAQIDIAPARARLKIIGSGTQLLWALDLGRALNVEVLHVPWCDEPRRFLSDVDIYVNASRTETYSLGTLEAMGLGLPVIARSVGAIPSYVTHGVNGLLFEDDADLPGLIERLACDPALRARLGARARSSGTRRSIWNQFAWAALDPAWLPSTRLDPLNHAG